jgi:hypothetical protein
MALVALPVLVPPMVERSMETVRGNERSLGISAMGAGGPAEEVQAAIKKNPAETRRIFSL